MFPKIFLGTVFQKNVKRHAPEKIFLCMCSKNVKQYFSGKWGWGQLWFCGSGPENYSPDLPHVFVKAFLVTKRVAVGAVELYRC